MPRFVVLEHDHPYLHWDFMLEVEGVLKTWRLPGPPPDQSGTALAIGDHRLVYLDYQGPVSGNRGSVKRWDFGSYQALDGLANTWTIRIRGQRWQGLVLFQHTHEQEWTIQFVPDNLTPSPGRRA